MTHRIFTYHDDSLSLAQRAKKALFALSQMHETKEILELNFFIYTRLFINTHEPKLCATYAKKCAEYLDKYGATVGFDFQFISSCFWYLTFTQSQISAHEFSARLIKLWSVAKMLYSDSPDPEKRMILADIFILASEAISDYTCELIDFGFSVFFLACQMFKDLLSINGLRKDKFIKTLTARRLLEIIKRGVNLLIGVDPFPLINAIHYFNPDDNFDYEWMTELVCGQKHYAEGIAYAKKFIKDSKLSDSSDIDQIAELCKIRLFMIEPMYALGRYAEAKDELEKVDSQLNAITQLYTEEELSSEIQNVIDQYDKFKRTFRIFPMRHRTLRLEYILDLIEQSDKIDEYTEFRDKWLQYVGIYTFHKDGSSREQLLEFESDQFNETLNQIEKEIGYRDQSVNYPPFDDDYLNRLYQLFYERSAGWNFILDFDGDDLPLLSEPENSMPHFDKLFEVYKLFFLLEENIHNLLPIENLANMNFANCTQMQLEFYLNLCYTYCESLYIAREDKIIIANLYLKIIGHYTDDNPAIHSKTASIYRMLV